MVFTRCVHFFLNKNKQLCWLGDEDSNPVPDFFIIELSIYCKPFFLVVYTWCLHLIPPQRRGFHG